MGGAEERGRSQGEVLRVGSSCREGAGCLSASQETSSLPTCEESGSAGGLRELGPGRPEWDLRAGHAGRTS